MIACESPCHIAPKRPGHVIQDLCKILSLANPPQSSSLGIGNLLAHKTFQWWVMRLPDQTLRGKAHVEERQVVEDLGLMNNDSNWGDIQIMFTQLIEQEDYWLISKRLRWWQKRAFWNIFVSGYAQTMYIFHPYILTLVFPPWCCSPFFHAGFSVSFQISWGEDCLLCLKNRKTYWWSIWDTPAA